jgi:hypothetical protein
MAGEIDNGSTANGKLDLKLETLLNVIGDTDATPKGMIDPLYEAKARVLSHGVSTSWKRNSLVTGLRISSIQEIRRSVSTAAIHHCRFRVGERQQVADCDEFDLYVQLPRYTFNLQFRFCILVRP